MKDKIAQLMKMEGLTTSRLAELLEIQPSAVSHLVSGRNNPRFDLIKRILRRFPHVNPDWLLLDAEEIYRDDVSTPLPSNTDDNANIAEKEIFGEEAMMFSNIASTESSRPEAKNPISGGIKGSSAPQPVRVMVLYDDGSFESFSMR